MVVHKADNTERLAINVNVIMPMTSGFLTRSYDVVERICQALHVELESFL